MNNNSNIYSIITLCLVLFIAYNYFYKEDNTFEQQEQVLQNRIDSLNTQALKYKHERDSLDNNILSLNDSLLDLQSQIVNKSNQIYKLKKAYAKKVQHINNYTVSDIYEYLTNRYKK